MEVPVVEVFRYVIDSKRKEIKTMQLLLSHWHCILPIVGIGVAFLFMREKPDKKKEQQDKESN